MAEVLPVLTDATQRASTIGLRLVFAGDFRQRPGIAELLGLVRKQDQLKNVAGLAQYFLLLGGRHRIPSDQITRRQPDIFQPDLNQFQGG